MASIFSRLPINQMMKGLMHARWMPIGGLAAIGVISLLAGRVAPVVDAFGTTVATALLALGAAACCFRASGKSAEAEKAVWVFLTLGAASTAAGESFYLVASLHGIDLAGSTDALYAAWATLYYFVFVGLCLTASLKPHRARAVRPALVIDTLLVAVLLLGLHYYFLVSYRASHGGWDRRLAGALLVTLVGLGCGAALNSCRKQAELPRWRRIYALLAATALCQASSESIYILLRDPQGGIAGSVVLLTVAADLLEMAALTLVALAAATPAGAVSREEQTGEPSAVSVWRELAVPSMVLLAVLSIPLWENVFSGGPRFTDQTLTLRTLVLVTVMSLYVLLVLVRQFLVQIENRVLGRDLQQESMRLRLLVDNIHDAVITEDLTGRVVFANERFLELFGLRRTQIQNLRLDECIHPEDRPLRRSRQSQRSRAEFGPRRFEFRGVRADGATLYLESSIVPVRLEGMILGFQSVIRDITERRRAEERQRELVQRLEFFVTNMPLGCIVFDPDFRIVEWNNSATRIFGWGATEVFGRNGLELLAPPEHWPVLTSAWEELQQTQSSNHRLSQNLTKDGGTVECEWFNTSLIDPAGRVVAVASMVQDVTEKKSLEAQLRQSQKMEAVGILAGGIAHDFNNLLTIILGNVSLASMRLAAEHPARRGLHDAEKAADRAAELVRQLLGFSRKSRSSPRAISLNGCVGETVDLLRRSFDPRVVIETRLEADPWLVEADPGQIHQILVNLCVNARDAMPEGGQLTIGTANRTIDEKHCRAHPEARIGEFAEFSVVDTGTGMDAETVARIFEPFFTTKEVGKGTGLGLAMVYGIVKQHDGWVMVESEPGKGSTFCIFLPRCQAAVEPDVPVSAGATQGGSETILLVDDEEMILRLGRAILESSGHRVLEARDGEEALQVFNRHRSDIELVVLDMMMPRKSGRDTLEDLHRIAPEVPVVLASGYALTGSDELTALGAKAYIQKPYHPGDLTGTIRRVLSGATVTAHPEQA